MSASKASWRILLSRRVLFVVLILGLVGVPGAWTGVRLCAEPLDISGTTQLPGSVTKIKGRDEIAYPAHATLGAVLDLLGCHPSAVGLQWYKAAAHARSEAEIERAVLGVLAAQARSASAEDLQAVLCSRVFNAPVARGQLLAIDRAGLRCGASSSSSR